MKVNIVFGHSIPFPPIKGGGIERIDHSLARALLQSGHSVTAYSRIFDTLPIQNIDEFGIKHIRIKGYNYNRLKIVNLFNSFKWCLRIFNKLESADATIFNTPFAFIFSKQKKLGVIANSVQRTPDWSLFAFKLFDRNYCTCRSVMEQANSLPFKLKNLKVLYNCVEIPTIQQNNYNASEYLQFLFFGRIIDDKGLLYLVNGFIKSLERYPENKLCIIGPKKESEGTDEEFYSMLVNMVKSKSMESKIVFSDPIYDKKKLEQRILDYDVVCFPSTGGEGFPSAVLEAMALGIPALVSDFGPMTEAIEHKKSGYISQSSNAESITEGIYFFSENKKKLKFMGEYARETVRKNFSAEVIANELIKDILTFKKEKN